MGRSEWVVICIRLKFEIIESKREDLNRLHPNHQHTCSTRSEFLSSRSRRFTLTIPSLILISFIWYSSVVYFSFLHYETLSNYWSENGEKEWENGNKLVGFINLSKPNNLYMALTFFSPSSPSRFLYHFSFASNPELFPTLEELFHAGRQAFPA